MEEMTAEITKRVWSESNFPANNSSGCSSETVYKEHIKLGGNILETSGIDEKTNFGIIT